MTLSDLCNDLYRQGSNFYNFWIIDAARIGRILHPKREIFWRED